MKQDIYIILLNKIKNKRLAYIGTIIIYAFFCVLYCIKKITAGSRKANLPSAQNANEWIQSVWPEKALNYELHNKPVSENVDLSIIIPVYNYENVVEKCIHSVLNQKTQFNYEIILVDDGSNKATKNILLKYQNISNVILITQSNRGISAARNAGLNQASGKYVMFVDCDDQLKTNCIQLLLGTAERGKYDIVAGGHELIKESDGTIQNIRKYIYPTCNLMNYPAEETVMNLPGLPWGKVYRRTLFDKVRFPENYWYEDTIIQFLIFRLAKTYKYIPRVVYKYYWYEGNYSKIQSQTNARVLEHYWIVIKMIEESKKVGLPIDKTLYSTVLRHFGNYLYHDINKLDLKTQKAVFVMACETLKDIRPDNIDISQFNFKMKEMEKVFRERNFYNWKYVSEMI